MEFLRVTSVRSNLWGGVPKQKEVNFKLYTYFWGIQVQEKVYYKNPSKNQQPFSTSNESGTAAASNLQIGASGTLLQDSVISSDRSLRNDTNNHWSSRHISSGTPLRNNTKKCRSSRHIFTGRHINSDTKNHKASCHLFHQASIAVEIFQCCYQDYRAVQLFHRANIAVLIRHQARRGASKVVQLFQEVTEFTIMLEQPDT